MKIGEVSVKSGLNIDTLRYYDKIGLLSVHKVSQNRQYTSDDLEKIHLIKKLKICGFKLMEIKQIFDYEIVVEENITTSKEELMLLLTMFKEKQVNIDQQKQILENVSVMITKTICKLNQVIEHPESLKTIVEVK